NRVSTEIKDTSTTPVTPTNIAPSIDGAANVAISEEGLKGGIRDTKGVPTDTTDSASATGRLVFTDPDSDTFTVTLEGTSSINTLDGTPVAWAWNANSNTLVGSAGGANVITIEVADPVAMGGDKFGADYTVTIHQPISHPENSIEDILNLGFNIRVSDGVAEATTSFTVAVEDDMPSIEENAVVDVVLQREPIKTNLLVGFDVSGSMEATYTDPDGNVVSRLEVAKKALEDTINQYSAGDNQVMVKLVLFAQTAGIVGDTWMTASEALAQIDGMVDYATNHKDIIRASTNYEDALTNMMEAFAHTGKFTDGDANNISVFLTDGHPNVSMGDGTSLSGAINTGSDSPYISPEEEAIWTQWLIENNIKSYAYSAHIGEDSTAIDPIAYDGTTLTDMDGSAATDTSGLAQNLAEHTTYSIQSVTATGDGSVFIDDHTIAGQLTGFGADGGYVQQITIAGQTYTFDGNNTITTPTGTIAGSVIGIITEQGGRLAVNMNTAEYRYASAVGKNTYQEQMTYRVVDGDGDGMESVQTWNVYVKDADGNISITGTSSLQAIDGSALGLNAEYYGYNDTVVAGNKVYADDTAYGNLAFIADMEGIIDGRNGSDIVGTSTPASQGVPDARFTATKINYDGVTNHMGYNIDVPAGGDASVLNADNSNLYKFTSFEGNTDSRSIVSEAGIGHTTDAGYRITGQIYLEPGNYDFRVTSDDGFRLMLDGQSVIEYDNNRARAVSAADGVAIIKGGLIPIEILYWEQGHNGVLHFEYKSSDSDTWQTLDLTDTLMIKDSSFSLNDLQDIVMIDDVWNVRTGDVVVGHYAHENGHHDHKQDLLTGSDGRDYIYGGGGNDTLIGGDGGDRFIYSTQKDNDADVIKDFQVGVDKIVFSDVIDVNAENLGLDLDNPAWAGKDSVSNMAWNDTTKTLSFTTADGGGNSITFENMTESYTDLDAFLKANAIL
ncbi:MAG: PA14 domain-containing protein, partial [Moraxella sp.]|nr:PA14 domain-containing protein [Moraxella sp.]